LSTEGGEVEFVKRMIDESVIYKDRIRIYTSLLGKKSSLVALKKYLKTLSILKHQDFIIGQGRTCRWILAWTFDDTIKLV
jgi:methyltransferase